MTGYEYIKENLIKITDELTRAAAEGGHPTPTLIAVTKSATDAEVLALADAGVLDIGENRTVMLLARERLLRDAGFEPRMHLIGSLQTNKVKEIVGHASTVHSLDRPSLADALERAGARNAVTVDALAEINIGREEAKGGLLPEEALEFCRSLVCRPHIRLRGMMTMAPAASTPDEYREYFREVKRICDEAAALGLFGGETPMLSMGMSGSYREAAACGATHVRVGRALFLQ